MKKSIILFLLLFVTVMSSAQTKIHLTVGDKSMTATLAENSATASLKALLSDGPVVVHMSDYGGFEKVGELPVALPTSNTQISTVPGDIMLYQSRNIVIFYGTNSWSYTRLGKIDEADATAIRNFLGNSDVELTLSLQPLSSIDDVFVPDTSEDIIYDMYGRRLYEMPVAKGFYIINGVKKFIR